MRVSRFGCIVLLNFLSQSPAAALGRSCLIDDSPRYQLATDVVEWSMHVVVGQTCTGGLRFANVILEDEKLVSLPQAGEVTLRGPGFTYAARSDFQGQDTFAIAVSGLINKRRGSSTIHVTVLVDDEPTRVHTQRRDNLAAQVTNTRTPSITTTPVSPPAPSPSPNPSPSPPPTATLSPTPNPPPTACSGVTGIWENITPQAFLNPSNLEAQFVAVDPIHFILYSSASNIKTNGCGGGGQPSCKGTGIYSSSDCGASWQHVSTGAGAAQLATGAQWAMLINPVSPSTMYVGNGYGAPATVFRSTDSGVDWFALTPDPTGGTGNFVEAIALDIHNPQHIAVTFHTNCVAPHTPMCISTSTDGGNSWTLVDGPSELTGWGEASSLTVLGANNYVLTVPWYGLFVFDGTNWSLKFSQATGGSYGGSVHIASNGNMYVGSNGPIYQSVDNGATWTPINNSPSNITVITDDGMNLYASNAWDYSGQPFWSAPLNNVTNWTNMPSPNCLRGAYSMTFDSGHHTVYAATLGGGLWRLKPQ